MVVKVGINGFGRIGRVVFRTCLQNPDIKVSAINDPAIDAEYVCYLMKFDSTHGKFAGSVAQTDDGIKVDDQLVKVFHEKLPASIPWQSVGVQYVVEASGMFTCHEKASGHLASESVKRVIVTAPSVDIPMIILGVNDIKLNPEQKVLSCGSSTLYCLAPIIKVLEDKFGVAEGFVTSIHAMTPSLKPLDGLCLRGKHWRDHRSIHQNIIPATTGACKALGKIIPRVKDKLSGLAFRVPIVNVSVLDISIRLNTNTTLEDIVKNVEKESQTGMVNIMKVSRDQAVSSDFFGESHSCILDTDSSLQLKPNFYKIICWYENEYSYARRIIDQIFFSEKQFQQNEVLLSSITFVRSRPLKKQERERKDLALKCNCNSELSTKILCSTSQDTGFKNKPTSRPVVLRKPVYSHTYHTLSSVSNRNKNKNELFRIWKDSTDLNKSPKKQNKSSFFHSCFVQQKAEKSDCVKAQERLENVKKEFSKMVNITEDLLKKSYSNRFKFSTLATTSKEDVDCVNMDFEASPLERFKSNSIQTKNTNDINPLHDVCGDCKSTFGVTNIIVKRSKQELKPGERNEIDTEVKLKKTVKQEFKKTKETLMITLTPNADNTKKIQNTAVMADQPEKNVNKQNTRFDFKEQVAKTITTLIDGLSQNIQDHGISMEGDRIPVSDNNNDLRDTKLVAEKVSLNKIETGEKDKIDLKPKDTQTSELKKNYIGTKDVADETTEKYNLKDFVKCDMHGENYNMRIIDEELKKRNIILVSSQRYTNSELKPIGSERLTVKKDDCLKNMELRRRILEGLNRFIPEPVIVIPEDTSGCYGPENTTTTSNDYSKKYKQDLYDKLDSTSATDSNDSFEIKERKSQVLHITDLTNSLEDLARLDKICRIIEISDELSDKLFSSLDKYDNAQLQRSKWSFKDFCEKIKLDDFCDKVFGKRTVLK